MPAFPRVALFVVLASLLFACGGGTPCRFDADCPYPDVCVEAFCEAPREKPSADAGKTADAGRSAASVDAGRQVEGSTTQDAGAISVDGGQPAAHDGGEGGDLSPDAGEDAGAPDAGLLSMVDAGVACVPLRCADVGATCGAVPDGCGGELSCGSCQAPETCGALTPNTCGCKPKTCSELGATCGVNLPDGCGGTIPSCGAVPDCGGGQWSCNPSTRACQCAPMTCASLGATCGENLADGCGGTIPYCGAGLSCGGGQQYCDTTRNQCACRPKTCMELGATCGVNLPDGCGGTIASCGVGTACGAFQVCGQQLQCVCASTVDVPDDQFQDTNCDGIDGNVNDAIFVSGTTGTDLGTGTRAKPVTSLARALQLAASSGRKAIYIAQGLYSPPPGWSSGVNLYGGYDTSWQRSSNLSQRAVITAPSTGWLLRDLTAATVFERLIVQGAPSEAGQAAVGLRLVDTGAFVSLRTVSISSGHAGSGAAGAKGQGGLAGAPGFAGGAAQRGAPSLGGAAGTAGYSSQGLSGGNGGAGAGGSVNNGASGVSVAAAVGGAGGLGGCSVAAPGAGGSAGATFSAGSAGTSATGIGLLDASGLWWPTVAQGASGAPGLDGRGGAGGGGGGKVSCFLGAQEAGGGGGGGGAGGTAGRGGAGGQSGGTSIALVLVRSAPSLTTVVLQAGNGGHGGVGGAGGLGGAGGAGGVGGAGVEYDNVRSGRGGPGGAGGAGSNGGRGGDGAPGGSVGIWCSGVTTPVGGNGTTFALGSAGVSGFTPGLRQGMVGCL